MAESLSNHSLGEAISRLIQRLSDADKTKTPEELEAMAKEMLEKRKPERKQHDIDVKKKEAEKWVEDAIGSDPEKQKAALEKLDKTQYKGKLNVATAKDRVVQVERVLDIKAPYWLKADSLQHSPQAIEFVARIAELSPELQNDPNVLYLETMRLHRSVDWSTSYEARKEVRAVMDRTFEQISRITKDPKFHRDALVEPLDPYHIKTLEPVEPAGKEPTKRASKKTREAWEKKYVVEEQHKQLQQIIDAYQKRLDTPGNIGSLRGQAETLQQFIQHLEAGVTPQLGADRAVLSDAAIEYIGSAQKRLESIVEKIQKETDVERAMALREQQDQNGMPITYAELKGKSWFLSEELSNKDFSNKKDDDVIYRFRYWNPEDVAYLKEHGYEKWFYQYVDRVFGLGAEQKQPGIAEQYVFDEFRYLFSALYGQEVGAVILQRFQNHWDSRGLLDYITHGMGMGAGNAKTRLELMERFRAANTDELKQFKYANLSFSFFESETFGLMSEKLQKYERNLAWLTGPVGKDFDISSLNKADQARILDAVSGFAHDHGLDEEARKRFGEVAKSGDIQSMRRDDFLKILNKEKLYYSKSDGVYTPTEFAKKGYQKLQTKIQFTMDQVARGVILEDSDVWGYSDIETYFIQTEEKIATIKRLDQIKTTRELTKAEEKSRPSETFEELEATRRSLLENKKEWVKEIENQFDREVNQKDITKYLADRRGLSKIELRVYERMREYLRIQPGGHEPDEVDLRMAIWAGRTHIIATGRMAAIGAMLARMPGLEYKTESWKHAMRAPAFEDLVRIFNVEMFADRFGITGDMGKVVRSYLRFNLRQDKIREGVKGQKESFFDTKQWKEFRAGVQEGPDKEMASIMEFAEKDLGIRFSELLAPQFMATGGQYDGSGWRLDVSVLDKIKEFYLKNAPEGAILDNQALAIRFIVAKDPLERKQTLIKMMKRTPSKFFGLLADKREHLMEQAGLLKGLEKLNPEDMNKAIDERWNFFEKSLRYAETDLWNNKEYAFREVDLAQGDFGIVGKYMENLPEGVEAKQYQNLLQKMQDMLTNKSHEKVEGGAYETYLDAIAKEKLPLTLSLDDFDWVNTSMKDVGELAYPRRTRDIAAMEKARNVILAFFSNSENTLSPSNPAESIKKLAELRSAIIDYAGPDQAEPVVRQMARLFIEANRDRALWSAASWTPLKALLPTLAEMDLRPNEKAPFRGSVGKFMMGTVGAVGKGFFTAAAKVSHIGFKTGVDSKGKDTYFRPLESVMNSFIPGWKHFSHEPFEHWPHSIAESISWSVRFTGAHGNRWNEQQMSNVIATMRDMGLFAQFPDLEHDLNDEFKAGLGMRGLATVRRYWWVAVFATAAIATTQAMKEEEKGGGH